VRVRLFAVLRERAPSSVVRLVTVRPEGCAAAPTGEDADPQECLWHFKGRGRRMSVIDVRHSGRMVARRAT